MFQKGYVQKRKFSTISRRYLGVLLVCTFRKIRDRCLTTSQSSVFSGHDNSGYRLWDSIAKDIVFIEGQAIEDINEGQKYKDSIFKKGDSDSCFQPKIRFDISNERGVDCGDIETKVETTTIN